MKTKELIYDDEYVRYKICGDQLIMYALSVQSRGGNIKKLSRTEYLVKSTDEVRSYHFSEKKYKDKKLLNKSLSELYYLLKENAKETHRCVGITLTYADIMRDFTAANKHFNRFIEKLRAEYGAMDYIAVVELQKRGSIHFHLVCIYSGKAPYIDHVVMDRIWKHGYYYVESVKSSTQIARYFIKYNLDLKESVAKELFPNDVEKYSSYYDLDENGRIESFVKEIAIQMLPPTLHIYRHSNGIKIPVTKVGIKSNVLNDEIDSGALEYSFSKNKVDEYTGDIINNVRYEIYNISKKKGGNKNEQQDKGK